MSESCANSLALKCSDKCVSALLCIFQLNILNSPLFIPTCFRFPPAVAGRLTASQPESHGSPGWLTRRQHAIRVSIIFRIQHLSLSLSFSVISCCSRRTGAPLFRSESTHRVASCCAELVERVADTSSQRTQGGVSTRNVKVSTCQRKRERGERDGELHRLNQLSVCVSITADNVIHAVEPTSVLDRDIDEK